MRKNVLMVLALLVCVVAKVYGSPVDRAEALLKAREFIEAQGLEVSNDMRMVESASVRNQALDMSVPAYYVFNNGNDNGFVIVAGDDRCYPILGYSDEGSFDMDDMPENLAIILNQYANQVACLGAPTASNLQEENNNASHVARAIKTSIQPMCTAKWGQKAPYNNSCPVLKASDGTHYVVGCTGVTLAQLLYYYKDRNVSTLQTAIDSYTANGVTVASTAKGTKIDWANMLDSYQGLETATQIKAVADLMFFSSSAIRTSYGKSASSASVSNVKTALEKQFGFYEGSRLINRTSYTSADWYDIIYNELVNGRPVFYVGSSTSATHAFLVDGYDGDNFYHVNWGWTGNMNGYFHLSALHGEEEESFIANSNGYTISQQAYIGFQPKNGLQLEDTDPVLSSSISSYNASTYAITTTVYNYTSYDGVYSYGYAVKDNAGNLTVVGTPTSNVSIAFRGSKTYSYTLTAADLKAVSLKKGDYKLVPVSKNSEENFWRECILLQSSVGTYFSFSYNPSASTPISNVVKHPVSAIKVNQIKAVGSCLANLEQPIRIIVENTGEDEYFGNLYLLASKSATSFGAYKDRIGLCLAPGEKLEVEMSFTPTSSGTWYVAASTSSTGATNLGYTAVSIASGSAGHTLKITGITINNQASKNGNKYEIYGNSITGKVKIENSDTKNRYAGIIALVLRQQNSSSTSEFTAESHKHSLIVEPGETVELDIDFYELDQSVLVYKVVYYYADANLALTGNPWSSFNLVPGVNTYDEEGNLVATAPTATYTVPEKVLSVDFTGVTGTNGVTKVVPNSNPNTIYILGKNDTTPSGLSGKNVVKDGQTSKLTLSDGYSFSTPKTFSADRVEFSVTPTIDSSSGWFTIALPFAPDNVTCEGNTIDWFHSINDSGKNFWLKEFSGMNGNNVVFDFVDDMKPNIPYIIAVPGPVYGNKWNLLGKKMVFSGNSQTITSGAKILAASDVFVFAGTTTQSNFSEVWALNDEGTKFIYGNYDVNPFRAYFRLRSSTANAPENLVIEGFSDTDAVMIPVMMEGEGEGGIVSIYNLSGIKVAESKIVNGHVDLNNLPNGVYVINGQKFVK